MAALAYKKKANTPHAFVQLAHKRASLISQMHAMPRVRNAVRQPVWIELTWITMQLKSASVAIGIIKKRLDGPAMTLSGVNRRRSDQRASVETVELRVALLPCCYAGQIIVASCLVHVDLYACGLGAVLVIVPQRNASGHKCNRWSV